MYTVYGHYAVHNIAAIVNQFLRISTLAWNIYNYDSIVVSRKSTDGQSTFQHYQRGRWALFHVFPH